MLKHGTENGMKNGMFINILGYVNLLDASQRLK
jgi:hypothetical protein